MQSDFSRYWQNGRRPLDGGDGALGLAMPLAWDSAILRPRPATYRRRAKMIERHIETDGRVRLSAEGCTYTFFALRSETLSMTIVGRELGQLGRAAIGEVAVEAANRAPLHLLIDMSQLTHVSDAASKDWTAWLQSNRHALRRVDVLAPEPFVRLVVAVSQLFSQTEKIIHIHTDPAKFAAVLRNASADGTTLLSK